eukprot:530545-Rhodomonas_salina.2
MTCGEPSGFRRAYTWITCPVARYRCYLCMLCTGAAPQDMRASASRMVPPLLPRGRVRRRWYLSGRTWRSREAEKMVPFGPTWRREKNGYRSGHVGRKKVPFGTRC